MVRTIPLSPQVTLREVRKKTQHLVHCKLRFIHLLMIGFTAKGGEAHWRELFSDIWQTIVWFYAHCVYATLCRYVAFR